jgi:hypothetical protein
LNVETLGKIGLRDWTPVHSSHAGIFEIPGINSNGP